MRSSRTRTSTNRLPAISARSAGVAFVHRSPRSARSRAARTRTGSLYVGCGSPPFRDALRARLRPTHSSRVIAVLSHRTLMVEVKGYPTTTYTRGPKAGLPKPTLPVSQARQWFSHAMLECSLMRSKYPDAEIAMAFPDMDTHLRLIARVRPSLVRLGFGVYTVKEDGRVQVLVGPNDS